MYELCVLVQAVNELPRFHVPDTHGLIHARGHERFALLHQAERVDTSRMSFESEDAVRLFLEIPQFDFTIDTCRKKPDIILPDNGPNRIVMVIDYRDWLAFRP